MNRAVRRQQRAAEAKQKSAAPKTSMSTSTPRAGPAQRTQRVEGHGLRRFLPRFISDIWSELMKVVWPSREDTLYMAVVVCIVTIIFGALLGGIDIGFAWLIDRTILDQNALFR